MQDREREKALLAEVAGAGAEDRVLEMTDRGEAVGWVAVQLDRGVLRMLKMDVFGYDFSRRPQGEEVFVLDTLMRSAASYGETFGASFLETAFPDFYGFFKARGFDADETHAFTPMSTIVHYEMKGC